MRRWLRDERGATAIEYGLIVALVTTFLIIGLQLFGSETSAMYVRITNAVTGVGSMP